MNGDNDDRLRRLLKSPGYWVSLVLFALVALLVAAFLAFDPDRTPFQYGLSRAILSLAVAGFAAFSAFSLLHFQPARLRTVVVLGQAIVVFLATYLLLPLIVGWMG